MTMARRFTEEQIEDRIDLFDRILIEHPRLKNVERCTHALLATTRRALRRDAERLAAANDRPIKWSEFWVMPIIGPSGAMKSRSMSTVIDNIYADKSVPKDDIPVLIVTMRGVKNSKAFQAAILEPLDPKQASELRTMRSGYHVDAVNEAIRNAARKRNTCVVAIDEAHSILAYDGGKLGPQMARIVHGLVNEGIFSIVLMGTDKVEKLFKMDSELKSRKFTQVEANMSKFDVWNADDRGYFFRFIDSLEDRMVKDGVVARKLGLIGSVDDRAKLFDMADGILGTVHRILRLSVRRAMEQGREYLDWKDIQTCFQAWNGRQERDDEGKPNKPGYDPFRLGEKKETRDAIAGALKPIKAKSKVKEAA
jgi:hypothetical protein